MKVGFYKDDLSEVEGDNVEDVAELFADENHQIDEESDIKDNSACPADFIPNGASLLIGVDEGSPDGDCTVKGFYKDGECHIQSVEYRNI